MFPDRAIFILRLHGDLPISEVLGLGVGEVDLTTGRTTQLRLTGKGQRERILSLFAHSRLKSTISGRGQFRTVD